MRTDHALRYLLLKQLWRFRGAVDRAVHAEVAGSMCVDRRDDLYVVAWTREGRRFELQSPLDRFVFYRRGDAGDRVPQLASGADNEAAAREMAAEMLGIVEPPPQASRLEPFHVDAWRWPAVCVVVGAAGVVAVHDPVAAILAMTVVAEGVVRSAWLYIPWIVSLGVFGYPATLIAMAIALAGITALAATTARHRAWSFAYGALALAAWVARPGMPAWRVDWRIAVPVALLAACAWTICWLSYEGPRLSLLLMPIVAVAVLADRGPDAAVLYLSASIVYASWLAVRSRSHAL